MQDCQSGPCIITQGLDKIGQGNTEADDKAEVRASERLQEAVLLAWKGEEGGREPRNAGGL